MSVACLYRSLPSQLPNNITRCTREGAGCYARGDAPCTTPIVTIASGAAVGRGADHSCPTTPHTTGGEAVGLHHALSSDLDLNLSSTTDLSRSSARTLDTPAAQAGACGLTL